MFLDEIGFLLTSVAAEHYTIYQSIGEILRRATLKVRSETQRPTFSSAVSLQTPDIKPFPAIQRVHARLMPGRHAAQVQQEFPLLAGHVGAHVLEKHVSEGKSSTKSTTTDISMNCGTYPRVHADGQTFASNLSAALPPSVFLALLGLDDIYSSRRAAC